MKPAPSSPRTSEIWSKTLNMHFSGQKTPKYTKKKISRILKGKHKLLKNMVFLNFFSILSNNDQHHWKADEKSFPNYFGLKSHTLKLAEKFGCQHRQLGKRARNVCVFQAFLVTNQFLVVKIQKMTIWCHTWLESYRSVVF